MGNVIQFPTPLPLQEAPQDVGALTNTLNNLINYINTIVYGDNIGNTVLLKANNLSDLDNVVTARTNLHLGSASTHAYADFDPAGAAAAVLASSLQSANNLSDLTNAVLARGHLGLGTAATMSSTAFDPAGSAAGRAAQGNNNDITALLDLNIRTLTTSHNIAPGDQYLIVLATTGPKTITYGSTVKAGIITVLKGDGTYNPVNISDGSTRPPVFSLGSPAVGAQCQAIAILKSTAGLKLF